MLALNWHSFSVESYVYLLAAVSGASIGIALSVAVVSGRTGYMVLLIPRRIKQLKDERQRELQREWEAWNHRRMTTERDGLPFVEPSPTGPAGKKEV